MKKLALLLFLISNTCFSQSNKIFNFIDAHVGYKVGSGICFDLVDSSYSQVNPLWKEKLNHGQYDYGKKVKLSEIKSGDVVLVWNKGVSHKLTPKHLAVVYLVGEKVIVAHQNVDCELKNSVVVLNSIEMFEDESIEVHRLK
jgi:hypothetical protein